MQYYSLPLKESMPVLMNKSQIPIYVYLQEDEMNFLLVNKKMKYAYISLLLLFITAAVSVAYYNTQYFIWLVMFTGINCLLLLYLRHKLADTGEFRFVALICVSGFIIRFLITIVCVIYPGLTLPSDALLYEKKALEIVDGWKTGQIPEDIFTHHYFYYIYNAAIYYIVGFYPSIIRILNGLYGILAALNLFFAVRRISGSATAKIAVTLLVFYPSLIFWQTLNLKEGMVMLFFCIIINCLSLLKVKPGLKVLGTAILFSVLLAITRSYFGIFMGGVAGVYFIFCSRIGIKTKIAVVSTLTGVLGYVTHHAGMGFMGIKYLNYYNLERIDKVRRLYYLGGSQVLDNIHLNNPASLIRYMPLTMFYFLFSPFPWQTAGSMVQSMAALENLIWYPLFAAFMIGAVQAYKKEIGRAHV